MENWINEHSTMMQRQVPSKHSIYSINNATESMTCMRAILMFVYIVYYIISYAICQYYIIHIIHICPLTWWNWSKWCEKKQADHSQCSEQRQTANHSPDILPPIYHAAAWCCPWLSGSNCSWIRCNPPENKDQPTYIHSKGTCMHCLMYLMRDLNINERFKYHFITFWCFIMIYNIHKAYIV